MDRDGSFHIVEKNPAVRERKPMNMQLEQGVVPRPLGGSTARWRGNVGGAVLSDNDMNIRLLNQELIQRNSSAPKRIDAQSGLDFVGGEKRLCAGGLGPVNYQMIQDYAHGEPADGHGTKFDFAAGRVFQAGNQEALDEGIASSAGEEEDHAQNRENGQHPGCVNDPGPNRVAAPSVHFATSSRNFSTWRRKRLSFSHCSACWLMPF